MTERIDLRRTLIYLVFAYGIAVLVTLVMVVTGGLDHSPTAFMMGSTPVNLALVTVACIYLFAPAFGHVLTRVLTHEGWAGA